MSRGNTGTCGTDIECLCELDELDARSVDAAKKDWHLQANARRAAALDRVRTLTFPIYLDLQTPPVVRPN
jgi:hypothetical protein